jgi:tRNA pseudouridine38-40 synthase
VNALHQVVSFALPPDAPDWEPARMRAAINDRTPPELICSDAARVDAAFHARHSASGRRYLYLVGAPPPDGLLPYAWQLPDTRAFPDVTGEIRLDVDAMRQALSAAIGERDFFSFARPGAQKGSIRTVTDIQVIESSWCPLVAVVIEGKGFLRAMIRHLVGTAVEVGLGLAPPSRIASLIAERQRYRGVRAPGWGLTLMGAHYLDDPFGPVPEKTNPRPLGAGRG